MCVELVIMSWMWFIITSILTKLVYPSAEIERKEYGYSKFQE